MQYFRFSLLAIVLLTLTACGTYQTDATTQPAGSAEVTPNELTENFLRALKAGEDASTYVEKLADLSPEYLAGQLTTREHQLAFWLNVYNGMTQYLLTNDPGLYDQRDQFFGTESFTVAGELLSPNRTEHAIIRGGENRLGLGYVPQLFPNKFERTFAIDGGDSRVHFALNCGAADCPPVRIFTPATVNEQLDRGAREYLAKHSTIKGEGKDRYLETTPLFTWFKGDFRDTDGVDDFLVKYGVLTEEEKSMKRENKGYDWTLQTGIWAE